MIFSILRIRRELRTGQLIPAGDLWPRFLFQGFEYNPKDAWDGLLRNSLLVKVRSSFHRRSGHFSACIDQVACFRHLSTSLRLQALLQAGRTRLLGLLTLESTAWKGSPFPPLLTSLPKCV